MHGAEEVALAADPQVHHLYRVMTLAFHQLHRLAPTYLGDLSEWYIDQSGS